MLLVLGAVVYPGRTIAQKEEASTIRTAGSVANLFGTLDANAPIAGIRLRIPASWDVQDLYLLRYGTVRVPIEHRRTDDGTVLVTTDRPIQGPHELVLRARIGRTTGTFNWQVTPFEWVQRAEKTDTVQHRQYLANSRKRYKVEVEAPSRPDESNFALDFGGARRPLLFRPQNVESFSRSASFTIEFWMRTTGLDEVVLSTWTGEENIPYPAEFTVDQSGRLRFYCGRTGQHQALRSTTPVADSRWHHAAVVYEPETSRIRLVIDGTEVDSARTRSLLNISKAMPVAIGGRRPGRLSEGEDGRLYSGRLDEVRIWPTARATKIIRQTKEHPIAQFRFNEIEPARLGFDEETETDQLEWPPGAERSPSSLSFRSSLRDLRARTDGQTVTLRWRTEEVDEGTFIVERSPDGSTFETVDRVNPVVDVAESDESQEVVYTDENVTGQIVYYRIRQVSAETGVERTTSTVKIGLGASGEQGINLVGNFPNPFEESTTISYRVEETQPLTLTVWDLAGKRVSTLASGVHEPGYYEKTLNAGNLPSGTYFARLETAEHVQSHRLVLVK